ncbi:MAG: YraN family protein [Actinomycetota bacterium]
MDDASTDHRASLGRSGEDATLALYAGRGFRTVARNWRCSVGEIDLIVERRGLLVFCEVKARSGSRFGGGHDAVTWTKQRKLRQLAEAFIATAAVRHTAVRFDVASVHAGPRGNSVELFEDAF